MGIAGIIDFFILYYFTPITIDVGILMPGLIGIILTFYSIMKLIYKQKKFLINNYYLRRIFILATLVFLTSFLLIESLIIFNSKSNTEVKPNYLIILGAGLHGYEPSLSLKLRLDKGLQKLRNFPNLIVIVSGGQGYGEIIPEALAMKNYLIKNGIEQNRILIEDKATSTMENFKYSKIILEYLRYNKNIDKVLVITSDFHMWRSIFLAKRNKIICYGVTCKTPSIVVVNCYIREYFAVIKSFFFDYKYNN